ncbi:chromate transporter [Curvibacter sp. HBC61]|uniref:Chromate transporter n=1 Tax=Curvibacter cyanobacteriorum TaxID=3026422 RepID=A0ABT5MTR8_9BURK|nr:chromate transporter [Curvibacter sp. HBC61]MDD0837275.1 chromate transporter [Curvibacter sp. HBC61]
MSTPRPQPERPSEPCAAAAAAPRPQPRSLSDLFFSFSILALQGFGGVLAVVQRELVEKKQWMTNEEFAEEWAVAQIMPGPNVVNLSVMIGERYFGWRGAVAALAGMLTFPTLVVLGAALFYAQHAQDPHLAGALRGMAAVAAGMVGATALKLAAPLRKHPLGQALCALLAALCFGMVGLMHWPLGWVIPGLGLVACALTWRKIAP